MNEIHSAPMKTFYFTYGTDDMQYKGGWTEIIAPNETTARDIFGITHARDKDGCLCCAGVYSEERFKNTTMYKKGSNLGAGCHERICLSIDYISDDAVSKHPDCIKTERADI